MCILAAAFFSQSASVLANATQGRTLAHAAAMRECPEVTCGVIHGEGVIMPVTFSCQVYAHITPSGYAAVRLLKLMGHSKNVPGALPAEDVQVVLQCLKAMSQTDEQSPEPGGSAECENRNPAVRHTPCTLPLIE